MIRNVVHRLPSLSLLALLAAASCVELTGQRITIRYDDARDELQVLILHDGIHDSSDRNSKPGREQIPEYTRNGDVLFVDWPGSIQRKDITAAGADPETLKPVRDFIARLDASMTSTALGHYRDIEGHIGAAQLVVITHARDFVRAANVAIRAAILEAHESQSWSKSLERMRAAAREGRELLALEGHAIRFTLPVSGPEWSLHKVEFFREVIHDLDEASEARREGKPGTHGALHLQLLALSPMSIEESGDAVTFRLGEKSRPTTYRFAIRDAYEPSLESLVMENAPADLDKELAARILAGGGPASSRTDAMLAWGPPEDAVRALLAAARGAEGDARAKVIAKLRERGDAWTREGRLPAAPEWTDDAVSYLALWRKWYHGVLISPCTEDLLLR